MGQVPRRRLAASALVAMLAAVGSPQAGAATPSTSLVRPLTVASVGPSVLAAYLAKPLTVPASGLPVTFGEGLPWGAVVLARQLPGTTTVVAPAFAGVASLPDGRGTVITPLLGSTPRSDGTLVMPAGHYALYLLAPPGSRMTVTLRLPASAGASLSLWSRTPVRAWVGLNLALASIATLTDRRAFTVSRPTALAVIGRTTEGPVAHDLAACLVPGTPPLGAEETCGTSALATTAESASLGYGPGSIAVIVPRLADGGYTLVLRGQTLGLGTGMGITTLRWEWTPPKRTAIL